MANITKENEAMVNSLNNTIQQIKETHRCLSANGVEDAKSCCVETGENLTLSRHMMCRGDGKLAGQIMCCDIQ